MADRFVCRNPRALLFLVGDGLAQIVARAEKRGFVAERVLSRLQNTRAQLFPVLRDDSEILFGAAPLRLVRRLRKFGVILRVDYFESIFINDAWLVLDIWFVEVPCRFCKSVCFFVDAEHVATLAHQRDALVLQIASIDSRIAPV